MALTKSFEHKSMDRSSIYDEIDATTGKFPIRRGKLFSWMRKSARQLFDIPRDCFSFAKATPDWPLIQQVHRARGVKRKVWIPSDFPEEAVQISEVSGVSAPRRIPGGLYHLGAG
jgi:hypothetical protein